MSTHHAPLDQNRKAGIRCPLCGFATWVKDSREGTGNTTRRRRMCLASACGFRFTTFEIIHDRNPPISPEALSALVARVVQGSVFLQEKIAALVKGTDAARDIASLTRLPHE